MATTPVCMDDPAPASFDLCADVQQVVYVTPFDVSQLDPAVIGAWWASGFSLVVMLWISAKSVGLVLQAIKRW